MALFAALRNWDYIFRASVTHEDFKAWPHVCDLQNMSDCFMGKN